MGQKKSLLWTAGFMFFLHKVTLTN